MMLLIGTSCDNEMQTRSEATNDNTIIVDDSVSSNDNSGITFEFENDSLEEDIEEIHFHTKEWEEKETDVDL